MSFFGSLIAATLASCPRRWLVGWVVAGCLQALPLLATDYYLGPTAGAQPGVSVASIEALNAIQLRPGDRVFFEGGQTFSGTVVLSAQDAGTADRPIVMTSFGSGRATVAAGQASAIRIRNAGGLQIRNLNLRGADSATNQGSGIDAEVSLPTSAKLDHLRLEELTITGFKQGVWIGAWYSGSSVAWPGFSDVQVSDVVISDVRHEGITVWGTWIAGSAGTTYSHRDLRIVRCQVSGVRGDPASTTHTGSGIVVGGVDGAVIEHCVVSDNGGRGPATGGGPFGIWAWASNRVTIQHNLVYHQKSSSPVDGGAFDLDGGTSNSVVQYNYSYGNEGPAVALIQFDGAAPLLNNTVRYNVSENDARKATRQGVLYVGNWDGHERIEGADIYGNTLYVSANPGGGRPPLVMVEPGGRISGVRVSNTLLMATHSGPLLAGAWQQPERARYQGNNYWGGSLDLAALRRAGQESLDGRALGLRVDPRLQAPGQGGAMTSATGLAATTAYRLRSDSPLRGAGVDLRAEFGIDPGTRDFFGQSLPPGAPGIGADARAGTVPAPPPPPPPTVPPPGADAGSGSLLNLSARSRSGTGDDVLIVGWVTEGEAPLLLRGVGPGLQPYGVTGWLGNPRLQVYDQGGQEIAANDDWGSTREVIESANQSVGAFALATRDAALTRTMGGGQWTAMVRGDARGVALAEIYRLPSGGAGRLVNLSARAHAGAGSETLIAGFVVGGSGARVLLRGLGPALAPHGVNGYLNNPVLRLYAGDNEVASNDDWGQGDAAAVRAAGFAPPEGSRDAALVIQLAPGAYTAHVGSADGRAGVALVEIYLLR
jgi:hypothetical protein